MNSFNEYLKKALQNELKKSNNLVIDENDSLLTKYIKKHKNLINEDEEKAKQITDEIPKDEEDMIENDENEDDETSEKNLETEEDEAEDYEKDEDEEAENSSCPIPTQDQTVNIENRQKAIDEFAYGPENINETNDDFWNDKKTKFVVKTIELAKQKKCGNCAAFTIKSAILTCLDKGIDKTIDENDTWDSDTENRGYCDFIDFKCHAQRTCDSWVEGGPLKDAAA